MMPTLAVATAHALVLTVSHGLLFRQPPFTATALLPPLLSNSPHSGGHAPLKISVSFPVSIPVPITGSTNRSSSASYPPSSNAVPPRANDVRAKPMKHHDLSTI
jgi:hypothetical protein